MYEQHSRNQHDLNQMLMRMDSTAEKYQSSKTQGCECLNKNQALELQMYTNQRRLISEAVSSMTIAGKDDELIQRLLQQMLSYVDRIIQLRQNKILCQCRVNKISQVASLNHTVEFLQEENRKFFKLFEQKQEECQRLKEELETLREQMDSVKENSPPMLSMDPEVMESRLIEIRNQEIRSSSPVIHNLYFKSQRSRVKEMAGGYV